MPSLRYAKPERIELKKSIEFNERWVQDRIAEDPSLLGLGDLVLKDKERAQPHAGRLDLLFPDADATRRYEVEVQLGTTDESHIIRTIEYWDIERKRYPQYEHTAVLVAEEVTSRFLNVIALFNGFIPLVAIQMQALKLGEQVSLVFTTVLDAMTLGLDDDDEDVGDATDRAYWEARSSPVIVKMADDLLDMIHAFEPGLELKYNKGYIGLAKGGVSRLFVLFRPMKNHIRLELRLDRSDQIQAMLDDSGLEVMGYDARWRRYRIRLTPNDLKKHSDLLMDLMRQAHDAQG